MSWLQLVSFCCPWCPVPLPSLSDEYQLSEYFHPRFWAEQNTWSTKYFESLGDQFAKPFKARHIELAREKCLRDANLWLLNYEPLKSAEIPFNSPDSDIRDWASAKAMQTREFIKLYGVQMALERCAEVCKRNSLEPIDLEKVDQGPAIERYKDEAWWLRKMRRASLREVEHVAITLGEIKKGVQPYCSDYAVKVRQQQKARNRALLETLIATNEEGQMYSIQELSDLSVANPAIRRMELMTRLRGFEEVAKQRGHDAWFLTITCPSKYHSSSKKYNGATPREAQKYLCKIWSRIRSFLTRHGVKAYGFRIAEPHKDGCPHWHLAVFCNRQHNQLLLSACRYHSRREDYNEKGANKARFKAVKIDTKKGSAVAYVAKYICKNIDGKFSASADYFGEQVQGDIAFNARDIEGNYIGRSDDAARRVEAWATCWGIRQFQQIGGPSVTVWRELRRMDTEEDEYDLFSSVVERARKAADAGEWAAFCIVMGGIDLPRKEQPIRALMFVANPREQDKGDLFAYGVDKETGEVLQAKLEGNDHRTFEDVAEVLNKYGEPAAGKVLGVTCFNIDYLTRFFEWDVRNHARFYAVEIRGERDLVPGWVLAAEPLGLDLCK